MIGFISELQGLKVCTASVLERKLVLGIGFRPYILVWTMSAVAKGEGLEC